MKPKPVIVLGAGGHAKVLIDILLQVGREILGVTVDDKEALNSGELLGIPIIGQDQVVFEQFSCSSVELVNGIGSVRAGNTVRKIIYNKFKSYGFNFANVVHPTAVVSNLSTIAEGVQVMAGAIIQSACVIGENCIINTGSILEHDCCIENHVHISSGAVLAGGVRVGASSHIGAGAVTIQGIRIGKMTTVGAGAVVIRNVNDGDTVCGVPATIKIMKE